MNENQWFALGIVLMVLGIYMLSLSTSTNASCVALSDTMLYVACTIKSVSYSIPGVILFAFGFAFLICGFLEKKK